MTPRRKPSAPRKIGANDNRPGERLAANENTPSALDPDPLTRDQLKRLAKAERKMASKDPSIRAAGKREIMALERQREARREAAELEAAKAETLELERLRDPGLVIEDGGPRSPKGQIKLVNRDGLKVLWLDHKLTEAQYQAGRAYREAYEEAERSLASNAEAVRRRMMGAPGGGLNPDWAAARRDRARRRVIELEARVAASTDSAIDRGRRLNCLRMIAGEGMTLYAVAGRGKAAAYHMVSLVAALEAIS